MDIEALRSKYYAMVLRLLAAILYQIASDPRQDLIVEAKDLANFFEARGKSLARSSK